MMSDEPPYILDIDGLKEEASPPGKGVTKRKWIGVRFECCGVYTRIYRNREGTAYEGHCPHCNAPVRVRIGNGGTDHRMFRAT